MHVATVVRDLRCHATDIWSCRYSRCSGLRPHRCACCASSLRRASNGLPRLFGQRSSSRRLVHGRVFRSGRWGLELVRRLQRIAGNPNTLGKSPRTFALGASGCRGRLPSPAIGGLLMWRAVLRATFCTIQSKDRPTHREPLWCERQRFWPRCGSSNCLWLSVAEGSMQAHSMRKGCCCEIWGVRRVMER